jgi:signal transduction histidine kinase
LLLGILAYWLAERTLKEQVRADHATATTLAAQNLQLFFTEKAAKAEAFARLPVFGRAMLQRDEELARQRLDILRETDPRLTRTFVSDMRGVLWSDSPKAPESLGQNFSHRDWFQGASRSGRPYLSGVYRRQALPALDSVALAHPYRGPDGRIQALLVLQYSLQDLGHLASNVPLGEDGWLMLLDPEGQVALHPQLAGDDPRRDAYRDLEPVRAALAGRNATMELHDPTDGRALIATAMPLELLGRRWAVAALQPQASAYAVLHDLRWKMALGALLLALLLTALLRRLQAAHRRTQGLNQRLEAQNQELQALNEELRESMEEQQTLGEELEQSNSELSAMQGSLQEQVDKRTRELADKDRQFQQAQKMEALGRLAGGIAHDFNNLLTVVLGHAELLKGAPEPEQVRESAAIIQGSAQRGAKLTSQLLSFARRQMVEPQPVDLNELVRGSLLRPLLGADVALDLELAAGLPKALVDPVQLEQALLNLVVNARDALPSRGGRIIIRTGLPGPDDAVAEPPDGPGRGRCVMLSVRDNGSGMEASLLPAIFEPFFTTKAVGKGTGLGLPMVQGAVRQAGGQVTVQSAPGQGSEFKLFLPIAGEAAGNSTPPDEGPMPTLKASGATLLLVEDEEALRRLGTQVLSQAGYQVLSAPDLPAALSLARAHTGRLDLLITDLVMPGGSGVELAHALLTERPDLHVILMTGYTESSLPDPSRLRYRFLQKPFAPAKLLRLVQESLA